MMIVKVYLAKHFYDIIISAATVLGVFVTYKIYMDGIKRRRTQALEKLCIEIASEYVIPYMRLMDVMKETCQYSGGFEKANVETVCKILRSNELKCKFYSWQVAKIELWDALTSDKRLRKRYSEEQMQTEEPIVSIENFIKKARDIDIGLKTVLGSMTLYLENDETSGARLMENYFNYLKTEEPEKPKITSDYVKKGLNSLNGMPEYIQGLPDELKIEEYCKMTGHKFSFAKIPIFEL